MAHLQWMSSDSLYLSRFSGTSPSRRGSNPKSLQQNPTQHRTHHIQKSNPPANKSIELKKPNTLNPPIPHNHTPSQVSTILSLKLKIRLILKIILPWLFHKIVRKLTYKTICRKIFFKLDYFFFAKVDCSHISLTYIYILHHVLNPITRPHFCFFYRN